MLIINLFNKETLWRKRHYLSSWSNFSLSLSLPVNDPHVSNVRYRIMHHHCPTPYMYSSINNLTSISSKNMVQKPMHIYIYTHMRKDSFSILKNSKALFTKKKELQSTRLPKKIKRTPKHSHPSMSVPIPRANKLILFFFHVSFH